ncbi:C39 family peptidase [Patescibacteria group bacterium]|nr:C39 family peptidase [Patescibacteria group bacterium]MBU1034263.1 C39 family peptidase [Patescibacteria group bacterium]MBU1630124.1 C39 family peptidase [Patescibacteria group bacterium]MBU1908202.1 C39 family peptidase [Patescibacteria group bacterium]
MKKRLALLGALAVLLLGSVYVSRGFVRDFWDSLNAPNLPVAKPFQPQPEGGDFQGVDAPSSVEGGYATSQNYILESNPTVKKKPVEEKKSASELPDEVNLDVPFTAQAPHQNWDMPYQEACEEAAVIMMDGFFKGQSGKISADAADEAIKKIVAFENAQYGFYEDTTALQTAQLIKDYYGYTNITVKPFDSADDIKSVLAEGYPVLIPAAGKLLHNPNFKNGGPPYHMLVIRGYTPDFFITNDPGTRKGQGYVYTYDTILEAAHDWTGSKDTVQNGDRVMIVVRPN